MNFKFSLNRILLVGTLATAVTSVLLQAASRIEQNGFVSPLVPRSPRFKFILLTSVAYSVFICPMGMMNRVLDFR